MLIEYMQAAMRKAHYEIIDDPEPFFGKIAEMEGLWATGNTLEQCRTNLESSLEDWLFISIAKNLPIPEIEGIRLTIPEEINA